MRCSPSLIAQRFPEDRATESANYGVLRVVKILFIHFASAFGGASKSLLELIKAFPSGAVSPYVVAPSGQVEQTFRRANISLIGALGIAQFDNTLYGHYRGIRWIVLMRELVLLFPTMIALLKAKRKWGQVDVIHANELTALPAAILAKYIYRAPLLVHVRSVQCPMDLNIRGRILRYLIDKFVDQLVAIDCTVKASLPIDLPVAIIRNGLSVVRDKKSAAFLPKRHDSNAVLRIAFIGGLVTFKGIFELIEAAKICVEAGLRVEFIVAGENPRDIKGVYGYFIKKLGLALDAKTDLACLIDRYNLGHFVKMVGFTDDVHDIYQSIDVLCFPSHLNACGRPVFEAALYGVPSIVAVDSPHDDTIVNGVTGICIPAKDPVAIANAIKYFFLNRSELERMGLEAYDLALRNFDIDSNAKKLLEIYNDMVNGQFVNSDSV